MNRPRRGLGGRAGRRPAVILTRKGVIAHLNKLTVGEVTAAGKGYPTEVAIGQQAKLPKPSLSSSTTSTPSPRNASSSTSAR